ncbi:MAG: hypothetical protein AAFY28_17000 [Actinomycetota bacterium]
MGWFRRNNNDADVAALRARIDELEARLSAPGAGDPPPPAAPLPAPPLGTTTEDRAQLADIIERLDALDLRVTSVSTELANQLDELAGDIDGTDTSDFTARLDAAVAAIRQTTEALAAEQARYEMQFRADLAEIADRATRGR